MHEVHPVHAFLVSQKKEEEKAPIEAVGRSATPPLVVQPQDEDVDEICMYHDYRKLREADFCYSNGAS